MIATRIEIPHESFGRSISSAVEFQGVDLDDSHVRERYDRLDRVRDEVLANLGLSSWIRTLRSALGCPYREVDLACSARTQWG